MRNYKRNIHEHPEIRTRPPTPRAFGGLSPRLLLLLLLLVAVAGCCGHPRVTDFRSTAVTSPNEACALYSPPFGSSGEPSPPPEAAGSLSDPNLTSEPWGQVRLASLETGPLADAARPLRLEDAIGLALERNPDLTAVRAGEPVADAAFQVAKTYPWNPQLQTQVLPYSRDRDGNDGAVSQQQVLVQTFELGGQQRFRIGAAAAGWDQVRGTIEHAELLNAAQTTRLYFAALYQLELRDMNQVMAELSEQLAGVIERRERAGQAVRADVELARLEARSSRRQELLASANYQTALMDLRNQMNLDASLPLELDGRWINWRWRSLGDVLGVGPHPVSPGGDGGVSMTGPGGDAPSNLANDDRVLRPLVAGRPDVRAAVAAVAMAEENVRLANAMRRPNLQLGPMWARDEASTEFWGLQGQIDIPVVNTGRTLVEQRIAELHQQQIAAAQLENRAVLEARAAVRRYERARRLVEQSRDELAPDSPEALLPFENQFKAGQITLLEVFAARAALAQSRQSFLDLLNELALAAADVTQAIGLPPQRLILDAAVQPDGPEEVPRP